MLSIQPTDVHVAPAAPVAARDVFDMDGWNTAVIVDDVVEDAVFDRMAARLAEMEDVDADWSGRKAFPICRRDWHYLDDSLGPVIKHRPTVTLFDGSRKHVLSGPVVATGYMSGSEPDRHTDGWLRHTGDKEKADEAANINSWMKWANRIDFDDEEPQPKKACNKTIPDHVLAKIEAPRKARQRVKERLEQFTHDAPMRSVAGRRYEPFSASYVRSDGKKTAMRSKLEIKCLELYSARLPKDALYGNHKGAVFRPSDTGIAPIFLRDAPYLTIGWWTVRGQLAVDLDTVWPDLDTLRAALIKALGPKLFPNIIVYRLNAKGEVENPHLIWILPPGAEVGVRGASRGAPIRKFNMVQRALVSHLIHLGADAGHLNSGKTKNPLSEFFSIACSDEHFNDLGDFVAGLPTVSTNEKEMRRRQAAFRGVAVEDLSSSMREWMGVRDIVRQEITTGFRSKDPEFKAALASEHEFAAWAERHVTPRALSEVGDGFSVRRILKRQIEWRSRHRPSRLTRQYDGDNRFRDRGLYADLKLTGAETPEARKAQGDARQKLAGTMTGAGRRAATLARVVKVVEAHVQAGLPEDEAAIVRSIIESGTLKKTAAYACVGEALSVFRAASRYIASPLQETYSTQLPSSECEVACTTVSRDPVIQTVPMASHPASGMHRPAKTTPPRRHPDLGRAKLRDLPDDPILEAVEIMRACAGDVVRSESRVHVWRHAATGQPISRTVH
ncbi:hypothetical protein IVB38_12635 [Bradyrhizobium sp. 38]|uniref:hypothetical protein n=1 Tax=unclassified Bradyrhizobium TaxID=2631580 RepID=UPI001FF832C2|nr:MULTISPECIES: hypothetical protein [unclassified Bradyrhizobium]MCK1336845.1 hypothetical protein [Bradyrhizobium sp. 38]MCK1776865.1 hypothetical protein [Bradyrhizobium sp. 132]